MWLDCHHPRRLASGIVLLILLSSLSPLSPSLVNAQVLTAQYDNMRSGANLNETTLTPKNVNNIHFGRLFTFKVDGDVYAQPLYLPDVEIPGRGKHNILFVATENDSVYAFDAQGTPTAPLWHVALANANNGDSPLSVDDVSCFFIAPHVGITSTPVIDLKTGTLYVLARIKTSIGGSLQYRQTLHALAITTGVEKFGGPVDIGASVRGEGVGRRGEHVNFDTLKENPRAALLLANEFVYLTWASSCDEGPYHGWMMAYNSQSLAQVAVFNTSPDSSKAGIWQGDAGPAADKDGGIFVVTGNGKFNGMSGRDFGDSILKLRSDGQHLEVIDFFTPSNQEELSLRDNDLGSSGPVLLPDQKGAHPHLLVTAGKEGKIYMIDRDHMGKYHPNDDSQAVQTVSASKGAFGAMAYWNQNIYFVGAETPLLDYAISGAHLILKASGKTRFLDSGATPTVSANGEKDGIVWAVASKNWNEAAGRQAVLHAYDASNVSRELYNTEQNSKRDRAGIALRFTIPTVVDGKVYVGAKGEVDVYGRLPTPSLAVR